MHIYTDATKQAGNLHEGAGNSPGWGNGGGDDTSLSIVFNIVVTLENHVKVLYSKKKSNKDREKTKMDNKQKQISLTVFQMNTKHTEKGLY